MPEGHIAENIATRLKDSVAMFNLLGKVHACEHDNAGNLCEEWADVSCFGHTLQLCVKPAIDIQSVSKTVAKCRKLVGHFPHSTTMMAQLRTQQELMDVPCHDLIQDVPTPSN